jgi:hypothetical protein
MGDNRTSTVRTTNKVTVIAGPHTEFKKGCGHCNGTGERFVFRGAVREVAWDAWREAHREYVGVVDKSMEPKFEAWWASYRLSCPCAVKHSCILFTAFGGPPTPQEPDDPTCKDPEASEKFWSEHALTH